MGALDTSLRAMRDELGLKDRGMIFNTDLVEALELDNMLAQASVSLHSAIGRTESRGAHAREDFPKRDDERWLKRLTLCWLDDDGRARLDYRSVHLQRRCRTTWRRFCTQRARSTEEDGMTDYDAIVIGTGQAGPSLARRLADAGQKVAVIERSRFGGTCINTGCTPTKTMVASAYAMHVARRGADYGFSGAGEIKADMKRIKARKDDIVGQSTRHIEQSLRDRKNCTVYNGHGRFVGPHEVAVGSDTLRSDRIFLDVGGRAAVPPIAGLDHVSYFTNSSMVDVDFLPRHLLVLGGSYIALEFGQMFRRFGSEVTIVAPGPRLIKREDEEVSQAVAGFLAREGVTIHTERQGPQPLQARRRDCHGVGLRG